MKELNPKQILSWIKKIKLPKIKIGEIAVVLVVLILSGIVIVPSIVQCVENNHRSKCYTHMAYMINTLSDMLAQEEKNNSSFCHDLIKNGNYQKLINVVNDRVGNVYKFPSSDYYIVPGDEHLMLMCKEHLTITDKILKFSLLREVNNVEIASKPQIGENILYLKVSGPDTYYEDDVLDTAHPDKMIFRGREVDKVINNLTVTAVYAGGAREVLPRNSYTVAAKKLNMSKSGQTMLIIKYNSKSLWDNSVCGLFTLDIIGSDDVAPLILDGGIEGRYELSAWDWSAYVEEAAAESSGKVFGASIIRYNGAYYYYPDGFEIVNSNKNTTPFKHALDTDDRESAAYYIRFEHETYINRDTPESELKAGNVKVENGLVYIWQEQASKELDKGWIRVYCDLNKY